MRRNRRVKARSVNSARGVPKTREVLVRHAIMRARERYDKRFGFKDIYRMNEEIVHGTGVFIEKQSSTRTVWAIEYEGEWFAAVYNKPFNTIVTFLARWKLTQWEEQGFLIRE